MRITNIKFVIHKKKWITDLSYTFSYFKLLMHVYFFPFPLSILGALFLHFEIISVLYLLESLRLLGTSFPKKYIYFVLPFGGFWGLWYQSLHSATIGANSGQVAPLLRGGDHSQIGSSLSQSQTFLISLLTF